MLRTSLMLRTLCATDSHVWKPSSEATNEAGAMGAQAATNISQQSHRKGGDNPADYLSCHSQAVTKPSSCEELVAEEYINFIARHSTPKAMTKREIIWETQEDATLKVAKYLIKTDKWY